LNSSLLKQELLAFRCSRKTKQIMQMPQEIQLFTDLWNIVRGKNNILICTWSVSKYELFVMIVKSPVQLFSMDSGLFVSTSLTPFFISYRLIFQPSNTVKPWGWFRFCLRDFLNRQTEMSSKYNYINFSFTRAFGDALKASFRHLLEKRQLFWLTELH